MATTFEDILKSYVSKIDEEWGNVTEDSGASVTNMLRRLNENYLDILRETGASWQPPATLTLTAVTATTNKHRLTTALGLSSGEVLSIDSISWDGTPLLLRDKKWIDEQYDYSTTASGDPLYYAFWGEYDDTAHDEVTYVAFYPFVGTANAADCKATYCKKPPKVTETGTYAYDSTYPLFADQYAPDLAEKMALQRLMESGDSKISNTRLVRHDNRMTLMKNHYFNYRIGLMRQSTDRGVYLHHGEWSGEPSW